jgi:hypothetical protein
VPVLAREKERQVLRRPRSGNDGVLNRLDCKRELSPGKSERHPALPRAGARKPLPLAETLTTEIAGMPFKKPSGSVFCTSRKGRHLFARLARSLRTTVDWCSKGGG